MQKILLTFLLHAYKKQKVAIQIGNAVLVTVEMTHLDI
jgi:hypothetical protein